MAKIVEELLIIKLSRLAKDKDDTEDLLDKQAINNIEQVIQELLGDSVVVEIVQE